MTQSSQEKNVHALNWLPSSNAHTRTQLTLPYCSIVESVSFE